MISPKNSRYPSNNLVPFFWGVVLLKLNSRKKGTLVINGLLGNLELLSHPYTTLQIIGDLLDPFENLDQSGGKLPVQVVMQSLEAECDF